MFILQSAECIVDTSYTIYVIGLSAKSESIMLTLVNARHGGKFHTTSFHLDVAKKIMLKKFSLYF